MIKISLQLKKYWKIKYHILVFIMVIVACILIIMEFQLTNIQTKDAVPVMVRRSSGRPNQESIGTVYQLKSSEVIKKKKKTSIPYKKQVVSNEVDNQIKVAKKEYKILTRIVEAEMTGGDIKSKRLVANVILNRVKDSSFPDTIEEVVFQKTGNTFQFSPVFDGRYYSVTITKETKKAVDQALEGKDNSKGALYFANRSYSSPSNMAWFDKHLKYLFSYGGHEYFTEWK